MGATCQCDVCRANRKQLGRLMAQWRICVLKTDFSHREKKNKTYLDDPFWEIRGKLCELMTKLTNHQLYTLTPLGSESLIN